MGLIYFCMHSFFLSNVEDSYLLHQSYNRFHAFLVWLPNINCHRLARYDALLYPQGYILTCLSFSFHLPRLLRWAAAYLWGSPVLGSVCIPLWIVLPKERDRAWHHAEGCHSDIDLSLSDRPGSSHCQIGKWGKVSPNLSTHWYQAWLLSRSGILSSPTTKYINLKTKNIGELHAEYNFILSYI